MKIGNDEVKLVEQFSELGEGMLVYLVGSGTACGHVHRAMLIKYSDEIRAVDGTGTWRTAAGYFIAPDHFCSFFQNGVVVGQGAVVQRKVYRVVDPKENRELWRDQGKRLYKTPIEQQREVEQFVEDLKRRVLAPAKEGR